MLYIIFWMEKKGGEFIPSFLYFEGGIGKTKPWEAWGFLT